MPQHVCLNTYEIHAQQQRENLRIRTLTRKHTENGDYDDAWAARHAPGVRVQWYMSGGALDEQVIETEAWRGLIWASHKGYITCYVRHIHYVSGQVHYIGACRNTGLLLSDKQASWLLKEYDVRPAGYLM